MYIAFTIITLVSFANHKEEYAKYNESMAILESTEVTLENLENSEYQKHWNVIIEGPPLMWLTYFTSFYCLLEVLTMLTNSKKRAIHDFIAGTEVRRLD